MTASPTLNFVTRSPIFTTSPLKSLPKIGRRGPQKPMAKRPSSPIPAGNVALRMRQSPEETEPACTAMSSSFCLGSGVGTEATCTTSGGPYLLTTAASIERRRTTSLAPRHLSDLRVWGDAHGPATDRERCAGPLRRENRGTHQPRPSSTCVLVTGPGRRRVSERPSRTPPRRTHVNADWNLPPEVERRLFLSENPPISPGSQHRDARRRACYLSVGSCRLRRRQLSRK